MRQMPPFFFGGELLNWHNMLSLGLQNNPPVLDVKLTGGRHVGLLLLGQVVATALAVVDSTVASAGILLVSVNNVIAGLGL